MFTSCTDQEVKSKIVSSLSMKSPLRSVCATVAFGMGVDCPDVRQVIHFGAPDNIEFNIQKLGKGEGWGTFFVSSAGHQAFWSIHR